MAGMASSEGVDGLLGSGSLPGDATHDQDMVDEQAEQPTSAGRGNTSSKGANGHANGLPPSRAPIKSSGMGSLSGSGAEGGTDVTDAANMAAMGLAGYDYENYADSALFGLSGDLDGGLTGAAGAGVTRNRQEKLKEKNRLAQRRFRARQKNMLEQMQARMDELQEQIDRTAKDLVAMQKDNHTLKSIVQEQQRVLLSAVVIGQQHPLVDTQSQAQLLQQQQPKQQQAALAGEPTPATAVAAGAAAAAGGAAAGTEGGATDAAAAAAGTQADPAGDNVAEA